MDSNTEKSTEYLVHSNIQTMMQRKYDMPSILSMMYLFM